MRLPLFAWASNLANFLRQLARPRPVRTWTLTTRREKRIKIGAKVVSRSKAVTFQMAEVAVPRTRFAAILERIDRLRLGPATGRATERVGRDDVAASRTVMVRPQGPKPGDG